MSTKVFISWSKGLSKEVGEVLNKWIPNVLPGVKPWMSSDMDKGAIWFEDISRQLSSEDSFGILILTPENITSPWILFEAGALYKGLGKTRVCPLLINLSLDELSKSPLQQFQCTTPEKEDMLKLIQDINSNREDKYGEEWVQNQFNLFWKQFEEKFSSARNLYLTRRKEKAQAVIYQQLNYLDKPSKKQIIEAFELLSSDDIAEISKIIELERDTLIRAWRGTTDKSRQNNQRQRLSNLIPLLEALIEIEEGKDPRNPRLHEHYAHLAFVYKDKFKPEWEKVLEFINKAISECDRSKHDLSDMVLYRFNKIMCYINLKIEGIDTIDTEEGYDIEKDFEEVWNVEQGRDMLMTIPRLLAPNLPEWMVQHKRERVAEWLKEHSNKQPEDWLNS